MKLESALALQEELQQKPPLPWDDVVHQAESHWATLARAPLRTINYSVAACAAHEELRPSGGPSLGAARHTMAVEGWPLRGVEASLRTFECFVPPAESEPMIGIAPGKRDEDFRIAVRIETWTESLSRSLDAIREAAAGEVQLRVVGRLVALSGGFPNSIVVPDSLREVRRPVLIGSQIHGERAAPGSVTCFVHTADGRQAVLSNEHVFCHDPVDWRGKRVFQPGRKFLRRGNEIGRVVHANGLVADNVVDAAMATLDAGVEVSPRDLPDGRLGNDVPDPLDTGLLDQIVHKVGRSSGLTTGRITAFNVEPRLWYGPERRRFTGQLEITGEDPRPVAVPGDSGALVYGSSGAVRRPIGQVIGGSPPHNIAYATPLQVVLGTLEASLLVD